MDFQFLSCVLAWCQIFVCFLLIPCLFMVALMGYFLLRMVWADFKQFSGSERSEFD